MIKHHCQERLSSLLLSGLALCVSACPDPNVAGGSSTAGDDESGDTGGEMVDDHRTYFIGESISFDGGGSCNNTELNTITSTLRNELDDEHWEGLRFVDGNTWAEDFQDPNTNPLGLDWVYGDASRLAIYAGHGNVGLLQWGTPSGNGACQMSIPLNARLGTLAGNRAAAVMFMTSCTLRTDALAQTLVANASRQFFGYHNSPYIGYDEPRKVFKRTQDGQSTRDAWLDEMEQNADVGKNSPVVVTFGKSAQDALESHGSTNLASGEGLSTNVGEPADNFIFTWYNNGCTRLAATAVPYRLPSCQTELMLVLHCPLSSSNAGCRVSRNCSTRLNSCCHSSASTLRASSTEVALKHGPGRRAPQGRSPSRRYLRTPVLASPMILWKTDCRSLIWTRWRLLSPLPRSLLSSNCRTTTC